MICDIYWRLALLHDYGFTLITDDMPYAKQYRIIDSIMTDTPSYKDKMLTQDDGGASWINNLVVTGDDPHILLRMLTN